MMKKEIRPAKKAMAEIRMGASSNMMEVEVKPRLMARQCASCGRLFDTPKNDDCRWVARMEPAMKLSGNRLILDCCSFHCAEMLRSAGWWRPKIDAETREISNCNYFRQAGAKVGGVEFKCGVVKYEEELIREWEAMPDLSAIDFKVTRSKGGPPGYIQSSPAVIAAKA